jgi:hypothetical protein
METKYYISVIGNLWMPSTAVTAMETTLTKRDWHVVDTDFDNLTLDQIEHWIYTHSGDMSKVIDIKIEKEITEQPKVWKDDDGWLEITHRSKLTTIREWSDEDSAQIFIDYLYPVYD